MIKIWTSSLDRDQTVDLTLKTSFENFINENDKTAFSLVTYLDDQFKKEFKTNQESEITDKIDKVIQIFRYLQDKDIFENHYKRSFAKRLLDSRRVLDDAEKEVIKKLKEECGFSFTQRLEVMFKDIKQSEQRMSDFKESVGSNVEYDLQVKVLTTGHWPNETIDPPYITRREDPTNAIPRVIKESMSLFKSYYLNKFSGRVLKWKVHLGHAELRAKIGVNNKKYELSVSTYQMCILMLFNDRNQLSFHDLLQKMQIEDNELKPNLIPLLKFKILQKSPMGADFKMEDKYSVNFGFQNQSYKVKIPVIVNKQQKAIEDSDIKAKVEDDRKHMIEAVIVKVMKSRKRLAHNELITEATKLLKNKFNPDPIIIKKRIEGLIERDYLERDKDDRKFYKYLA
jgi:cullin 3